MDPELKAQVEQIIKEKAEERSEQRWQIIIALVLYLATATFSYGAFFGMVENDESRHYYDAHGMDCRKTQAGVMGLSLIPGIIVITPFVSGFYVHGFRWLCPIPSPD